MRANAKHCGEQIFAVIGIRAIPGELDVSSRWSMTNNNKKEVMLRIRLDYYIATQRDEITSEGDY